MYRKAVDVNREVVVGDDVLAGARIVDVGCKAFGGGVVADARVVDVGPKAVDGGCNTVGGRDDVDEGHDIDDEDDVLVDTVASPLVVFP